MARIWRNSPGQLLALYLILWVIALAVVAASHPSVPVKSQPLWLPVAAFLAAFMSTIGTQLNWGSSYLVNDLYKRFFVRGAT